MSRPGSVLLYTQPDVKSCKDASCNDQMQGIL